MNTFIQDVKVSDTKITIVNVSNYVVDFDHHSQFDCLSGNSCKTFLNRTENYFTIFVAIDACTFPPYSLAPRVFSRLILFML